MPERSEGRRQEGARDRQRRHPRRLAGRRALRRRSRRAGGRRRWATTRSPGNDDFELGGYPAVNDALHGWLRDDVWVLGSKMYVVVARPVEYDATQRPAGAIVGLKEVNKRFAERPRQAHAHERRVLRLRASAWPAASASRASTRRSSTRVGTDLKNVDDKTYGDSGASDVRGCSPTISAPCTPACPATPGRSAAASPSLRARRPARRPDRVSHAPPTTRTRRTSRGRCSSGVAFARRACSASSSRCSSIRAR